jgi:surface protein
MNKSKFIHILFAGIFKFCIIFLFLLGALNLRAQSINDFVTRWDLSKTGSAVSGGLTSITFNTTNTGGSISYTWQEISPGTASGSGTFTSSSGTSRTISGLPQNATIELRIAPTNLQQFYINKGTDRSRLTDVTQWGTTAWNSMLNMFYNCNNLNISATDLPNLSDVTNMMQMFRGCTVLNGPSNIGSWNTSNITSVNGLFMDARAFNQNIGAWNIGKVTDMDWMFYGAAAFNMNISSWNTGNVTTMARLFSGATAFNQDINNWNTSNVTNMLSLFRFATNFNQNINNWNTSKVTNMRSVFDGATAFNGNITNWNTSNVTDMTYMFARTGSFNQNIGNWNTSKVTNMSYLCSAATAFNQNIGNWNTSNVTDMSAMFYAANSFNQDISSWNTSNVTNMGAMFFNASAFDQNLGNWVLNSSVILTSMLHYCGMSCDNYSKTLAGWSLSSTATGRTLGAWGITYGTNVTSLHSNLTTATPTGKGWTISDGGVAAGTCGPNVYYSKSSGNLDDLATWGTNTDGTGTSPTDFITANQIFVIRNRSTVSLGGNWAVSGTDAYIVLGDGSTTITFSTGSNTISGNYRLTKNATLQIASNSTSLNINCETGSTVNFNGTGNQTIIPGQYDNLTLSNNRGGGTITLGSGTIFVRGTLTNNLSNVGNWNNTGNIFDYNGTGDQTIAAINYNNLIISGSRPNYPTITLQSGTISVAGNASFTAAWIGSWTTAGNTINYNGTGAQQVAAFNYNNLTISGNKNNGAIMLENGTISVAATLNVSASNVGSWITTGNTVDFNGTVTQSVSSAIPYNNLTISGSSRVVILPSATITIAGNGSNSSTGTITWSNSGNTIDYNGTGAQQIGAFNYNNLTASGNKNNGTITLQNSSIRIAGTVSFTATNVGSWVTTGSTVEYNGTGAQTVTAMNYNNLTISGARTGSPTVTLQNSGTIGVAGTLSVTATGTYSLANTGSTVDYNGTGAQSVAAINYNNLTISGARSGSPAITLPSGTVSVTGNATFSATGVGSWTTTGNTFNYNGTGAQQVAAFNYENLTISGNKNSNPITLQSGNIGVGGTLTVSATNIGSWTTTGNTLEYNGSSAQTIISSIPYRNLSIAGSNTKTLNGNTTVAGDLTLSNKLILGAFNLTLSGNASGGSSSNYVQTSGTGTMKKNIGTSTAFNFPVGNSAYNPVSITNNTTSSDEFSVRILDEVMYGGTTGNVATEPRVKRTWLIDKTTPTANSGSGVDFTFNWNSGEMVSVTTPALYHFNGTKWQKQTGTTSSTSTSLTYTGYMGSFSPFSIGDDIVLLPVNWLHFHCESGQNQSNKIHWSITGENNKPTFWIERSAEGITYHTIGKIYDSEYGHNLRHYSFTDAKPLDEINYYRVRTVDDDGYTSYSSVCMQKNQPILKNGIFKISPNPTSGMCTLMAPESDFQFMWEVFSSSGKLVTKGNSHAGKAALHLQTLSDGVYQVKVTGEGFAENHKLLIQH